MYPQNVTSFFVINKKFLLGRSACRILLYAHSQNDGASPDWEYCKYAYRWLNYCVLLTVR